MTTILDIKQFIEEYPDDMHIAWDIFMPDVVKDHDESLTDDQVNKALDYMHNKCDSNHGLNWDGLQYAIEQTKGK